MQCFLLYIDDWLSSKKIELMDTDEELAYLHMLMKSAKEPDCGLPDDDNMLAVISGLGPQWFKATKNKLKRFGSQTSGQKLRQSFRATDGRIFNDRLVREWNHQREVNEKRMAAGRLGGRPRKANDNQTVFKNKPNGLANGKQNETNHSLGLGLEVESDQENSKTPNLREFPTPKTPEGFSPETWQRFMGEYAKSGKPLNDRDWDKAAHEAISQGLTDEDFEKRVGPALLADLANFGERPIDKIPFPANWLSSVPWTRTAQPRAGPASRKLSAIEQRSKELENDPWMHT